MAGLLVEIEESAGSSVWVDMLSRFTNLTGTPLVSADANPSGQGIADVYQLTFASVVASTSATVKVQAASPDNPYTDQTGVSVALDGTTEYRDIIGGAALVFSASGSFTGSWTAEIRIGYSFGAQAGFGAGASEPAVGRRIRVTNDDSDPAQAVTASLVRHAKLFETAGRIFEKIFEFAAGATESLTSGQVQPYHVSVANVTGSGGSKTMDLKVGGSTVNVENVTTPGSGVSTGLNVTDIYRITSGGLTDLEFQLSQDATNSDTANVLIFNQRYTQIAPDAGGGPGDYDTVDVSITESGQAEGVITAGGHGFFWVRSLVPDGAISGSNPYPMDVMLSAEQSSPAGWTL